MIKSWIRLLYIKLASWDSNEWTIIGKTIDDSKKPRITISGSKYLSPLSDNFSVKIYNLPYSEIAKIQVMKKYHIQIYCGYLGSQSYDNFEAKKIFDGGLVSITCSKRDYKDSVVTLICANKTVAKAQEWRCNVSFNSGINMYSAIKYMTRQVGLTNINVSDSFRNVYLTQANIAKGSIGNYFEELQSSGGNNYFMTTDGSEGNDISLFSNSRGGMRKVFIDATKGMIVGGYPQVTSNGLNWSSLPTFNYMCSDLCVLDNSYIDVSNNQDNYSGVTSGTPNSIYLNTQGSENGRYGLYYIYDLSYDLDNTNGNFLINIHAKSKDLIDNVTGTTTTSEGNS